MRAVAEQRFGDAQALRKTGQNERANGAVYLGGFVIEILLKTQLLEKPGMGRRTPGGGKNLDRIRQLIWSGHDLPGILDELPELEIALEEKGRRDGRDYVGHLKGICETWTIQARYSSRKIDMNEASKFLDRVAELKEVLK